MRLPTTLAVWALLGLLWTTGLRAAPLSDSQRQEDPALDKRVTLVSQRIYFGDMIERLSLQSGVPLSVGPQDGAGDVEVAVSLRDVPLVDALNGLWSLVSYHNAEWDWARTGTPGHYQYQLKQPVEARALAQLWRQQIQDEFVAQTKKMLLGLKMTPDELQESAKTDPLLASLANDKDPRVRPEMEIVAGLTPATLNSLLNDRQGLQILVTQLSPAAREFVHQQWLWTRNHGGMTRDRNGNLIPVPEPQSITLVAAKFGQRLAPSLLVDDGFGGGDLTGGGWMEKSWHDKITAAWMLPGDAPDDLRSSDLIPTSQKRTPDSPTVRPLALHVTQMGQSASLPVIARLPDERGMGSNISDMAPYGMSVQAYLDRLRGINLQRKWRGGVVLIADPAWFMHGEDTAAPWSAVAALRDAENAAPVGILPLNAILRAIRPLNQKQVADLAEQFPVMANVAQWYGLFSLMTPPSDLPTYLLSPSGSTRLDAIQAAGAVLPIGNAIQDGTARRIHVTQTQTAGAHPRCSLMIEVRDGAGNLLAGQGFSYAAHQFQSGAVDAHTTILK